MNKCGNTHCSCSHNFNLYIGSIHTMSTIKYKKVKRIYLMRRKNDMQTPTRTNYSKTKVHARRECRSKKTPMHNAKHSLVLFVTQKGNVKKEKQKKKKRNGEIKPPLHLHCCLSSFGLRLLSSLDKHVNKFLFFFRRPPLLQLPSPSPPPPPWRRRALRSLLPFPRGGEASAQ